ncbi:MAG: carbonic anhydrase [Deltaproteobacteria bacterium]|nr:carbonic anhydrase [Deltaproteobacteria bacterium]
MTKHLLSGHAHFRAEYFAGEADFLRNLASAGQKPSALYIGCSDSRVVPELLTSSRPGELFVVRNIANVIPVLESADSSVGAAVDYAVEKLGVPHIIVCGHDGCGGVKAAIEGIDQLTSLASLHEWLQGVVPAVATVRKLGLTGDELTRAAVEENVLTQMDNLISFPSVARGLAAGTLALHGWVFDLAEGALRVYDVDTQEFVTPQQLAS